MPQSLIDQLIVTIILGLIQGFTEWLPISSTAHLKITEHFLGFQATPLFNVFLHIGTLGVVIFYFRSDIKIVLTAIVHRDFHSEYGRLLPLIIVATIPTAIIGLLYDKFLADNYQTSLIMGITFIMGATLLVSFQIRQRKTNSNILPQSTRLGSRTGGGNLSRTLKKRLNNIKWTSTRR